MKIIEVKITPIYSCQYCGKEFESSKDFVISPNFYPVCSHKCGFNVIYQFIKKQEFSSEMLEFMAKKAGFSSKTGEFNRQKAIFAISKFYKNRGLSTLKFILGKGQTSVPMDKNLSKGQRDNNCVCIYTHNVPCLVPLNSEGQKSNLVPSGDFEGGLNQWF